MKALPGFLKGLTLCATILVALGFTVNTVHAAQVVITIGPAQEYDNLSEAEANIVPDGKIASKDLVLTNTCVIYECYGEWEESVDIAGWNTNSSCYLSIEAGLGRPLIYNDDADGYVLSISSHYVRISGLQLLENTASGDDYALFFNGSDNIWYLWMIFLLLSESVKYPRSNTPLNASRHSFMNKE